MLTPRFPRIEEAEEDVREKVTFHKEGKGASWGTPDQKQFRAEIIITQKA